MNTDYIPYTFALKVYRIHYYDYTCPTVPALSYIRFGKNTNDCMGIHLPVHTQDDFLKFLNSKIEKLSKLEKIMLGFNRRSYED